MTRDPLGRECVDEPGNNSRVASSDQWRSSSKDDRASIAQRRTDPLRLPAAVGRQLAQQSIRHQVVRRRGSPCPRCRPAPPRAVRSCPRRPHPLMNRAGGSSPPGRRPASQARSRASSASRPTSARCHPPRVPGSEAQGLGAATIASTTRAAVTMRAPLPGPAWDAARAGTGAAGPDLATGGDERGEDLAQRRHPRCAMSSP